MPVEFAVLSGYVSGFLMLVMRVGSLLYFIPIPPFRFGLPIARVVLTVGIAVALLPIYAPVQQGLSTSFLVTAVLSEAVLGLSVGLMMSILSEGMGLAAQAIGLQAGYSYASTIDPTTQADSSVLIVFSQLAAGMLLLSLGLDRTLIRWIGMTLELVPLGSFSPSVGSIDGVSKVVGLLFSLGMRIALPVVALLLMVDLALALLGRISAQLQVIVLAFPIKMIIGIVLLAFLIAPIANVFRLEHERLFSRVSEVLRR